MKNIRFVLKGMLCLAAAAVMFSAPLMSASHTDCCCSDNDFTAGGGCCESTPVEENSCGADKGGCGCIFVNPAAGCLFGEDAHITEKKDNIVLSILKYDLITSDELLRPPAGSFLS